MLALRLFSASTLPRTHSVPPPRPPTFTTPDLPLPTTQKHDSTKPLPPTDLPVEDYASPLLHTGQVFASVFRYAVYASVAIVALGSSSWLLAHLWVEKVELAGSRDDDDEGCWSDEAEGWSGAHLGGGTDPRLGIVTRFLVRAAWMNQHWTSPNATLSPVAATSSSPFAVGGTMIGSPTAHLAGKQVGDVGWHHAEAFLVRALDNAAKKGVTLGFPAASEGEARADRAAVQLEQRLAGLRERIGGRYHLELAREGWERIFYALSSTVEPAPWEAREKVRATRKLGEISARLSDLWPEGSQEQATEKVKAEGWLLGGLLPALQALDGGRHTSVDAASTKSVSPSSSFFGFWSRSHPPSSPSPVVPSSVRPELTTLLNLLYSLALSPPDAPPPALARGVLNSLITLETFLARERQLPAAQALQKASLGFANAIHPSFRASPSPLNVTPSASPSAPALPWSTSDPKWTSAALGELFLSTRTALLATHLAEVTLALRAGHPEEQALTALQGAVNDCSLALSLLSSSPFARPLSPLSKLSAKPFRIRFDAPSKALMRDAKLTGAMAARLVGYVHESGCGGLARRMSGRERERTKRWCGGDAIAEAFYAKSLEFSKSGEAEEGLKRTRKRVLKQ